MPLVSYRMVYVAISLPVNRLRSVLFGMRNLMRFHRNLARILEESSVSAAQMLFTWNVSWIANSYCIVDKISSQNYILCLFETATAIKYPEVPIIRLLPPLTPVPPALLANTARAARTDLVQMKVVSKIRVVNQLLFQVVDSLML